MSGIDRSIRMALGRSLSAFSTASAPFAAVATRYPAYSRYSAYISRASWKSSTTRTSSPSPHLSLGLAGSPNLGVELAGGVASMCIGRRDDGKRIASGPAASRRRANGTDRRHIRVKCSILLPKLPSIAGPPTPPPAGKNAGHCSPGCELRPTTSCSLAHGIYPALRLACVGADGERTRTSNALLERRTG